MNKSETVLSEFSTNMLFKEFILDDLCYTPIDKSSEIELADLIINLGDYVIAIQLKERDDKFQTFNREKEEKWLIKKSYDAKSQIKTTLQLITSWGLPVFFNKRGQDVRINHDARIVPLVIFMNDSIDTYSHLLKKHSDNGLDVNCMSFSDFQIMCNVLFTPYEIVLYLDYRKKFYINFGEVDYFIGVNENDYTINSNNEESLAIKFLYDRYRDSKYLIKNEYLIKYKYLIDNLHDHLVFSTQRNADLIVVTFLGGLDRRELIFFARHLVDTIESAKNKQCELVHSLRTNRYAVIFVSSEMIDIDDLINSMPILESVNKILEVVVYWINEVEYRIDFILKSST